MKTCVFNNGANVIVCTAQPGGTIFEFQESGNPEVARFMFQSHDFRKLTDSLYADSCFYVVAQRVDVISEDRDRVTQFLEKFL